MVKAIENVSRCGQVVLPAVIKSFLVGISNEHVVLNNECMLIFLESCNLINRAKLLKNPANKLFVIIVYQLLGFLDIYILSCYLFNRSSVLLQCDPESPNACDAGCGGGLMTSAFEYTLKAGGLQKEEDYPYTGKDRGPCKFDKTKIAASVSNFSVISLDEDQIAANLVKHGPLAGLTFSSLLPY